MPPRKKPEVPAEEPDVVEELDDETEPDEADEDSDVEQPCTEHYPYGWKGVPAHHDGVGCEHGSWTRPES